MIDMIKKSILLLALVIVFSCNNTPLDGDLIPYVRIEKLIDLNNLSYQALKFDRGFVYENGGVRGLIIYRKSAATYVVFERTCSYQPSQACAKVDVDPSGFFMIDKCCNSQFDLDGNPISGVAIRRLLTYPNLLNGSLLTISN